MARKFVLAQGPVSKLMPSVHKYMTKRAEIIFRQLGLKLPEKAKDVHMRIVQHQEPTPLAYYHINNNEISVNLTALLEEPVDDINLQEIEAKYGDIIVHEYVHMLQVKGRMIKRRRIGLLKSLKLAFDRTLRPVVFYHQTIEEQQAYTEQIIFLLKKRKRPKTIKRMFAASYVREIRKLEGIPHKYQKPMERLVLQGRVKELTKILVKNLVDKDANWLVKLLAHAQFRLILHDLQTAVNEINKHFARIDYLAKRKPGHLPEFGRLASTKLQWLKRPQKEHLQDAATLAQRHGISPKTFTRAPEIAPVFPLKATLPLKAQNWIYSKRMPAQDASHIIGDEKSNIVQPNHAHKILKKHPKLAPVIVVQTPSGKWYVVDGNHRVFLATEQNAPFVACIYRSKNEWDQHE